MPRFPLFEKPSPGWELDLVRRFRVEGGTHYHVQLIRRVDGATVYDMSDSLEKAFNNAVRLAEELK